MMETEQGFTGPVNVGNPTEYTILELAETVLAIVGGTSRITYKPLPIDDPRRRQPDISLAKEKLLWTPKVEIEDGLRETIRYFRDLMQ